MQASAQACKLQATDSLCWEHDLLKTLANSGYSWLVTGPLSSDPNEKLAAAPPACSAGACLVCAHVSLARTPAAPVNRLAQCTRMVHYSSPALPRNQSHMCHSCHTTSATPLLTCLDDPRSCWNASGLAWSGWCLSSMLTNPDGNGQHL